MKALFASVLATAGLIVFFVPRGQFDPARDRTAQVPAAPGAQLALATATPSWSGDAMALEREDDGHFYASVQVDGRNYRMLVDTGATVVALTGDDARAMGLDWNPGALAPVAKGVGGTVMGVMVKIPTMTIGDFEARDVPAVIIPEGLGISLLGQSFLSHIPNVDIADDKLTLSG